MKRSLKKDHAMSVRRYKRYGGEPCDCIICDQRIGAGSAARKRRALERLAKQEMA